MFLFLSKTLDKVASPFAWVLLLGLLGVFLRKRRPSLSAELSLASIVLLGLSGFGPVADGLWRLLESSARNTMRPDVVYDAVIVLGGMTEVGPTSPDDSPAGTSLNASADRVLAAFELLRKQKVKAVLLSGGDVKLFGPTPAYSEAYVLAAKLRHWGVPEEQIVIEGKSRNTHENAVASARIVREKGWKNVLLLTSAFHMNRAAGCFRAEGVTFDMVPVDYRQNPNAPMDTGYWPSAASLEITEAALREYLGRLVYRVRGYSVAAP